MSRSVRRALSRILILAGCSLLASSAAYYGAGVYAQATVPADLPLPASEAPPEGAPLLRLRIPKIGLETAVFEGISDASLIKGPGHLPGTDVPGRSSAYNNCVIAGHRDSFFRKLGWLRAGDSVRVQAGGIDREYRFVRRRVVKPEQVAIAGPTKQPQLTLITCYPFDWIGPAPYRLIWEARPVAGSAGQNVANAASSVTRGAVSASDATKR